MVKGEGNVCLISADAQRGNDAALSAYGSSTTQRHSEQRQPHNGRSGKKDKHGWPIRFTNHNGDARCIRLGRAPQSSADTRPYRKAGRGFGVKPGC